MKKIALSLILKMEKTMKPTKTNEKILGDFVAQKIQDRLNKKKNFALNLVEGC